MDRDSARALMELLRSGSWSRMDEEVDPINVEQIDLPRDYLTVVDELGSGFAVDDKLSVLHPKVISQDFRQHQLDLGQVHEKSVIPIRQGKLALSPSSEYADSYVNFSSLICWGLENSGKKIFWDVSNPVRWPVVATDCSGTWARHDDMTFSTYLESLLSRKISCPVFTRPSWPDAKHREVLLYPTGL